MEAAAPYTLEFYEDEQGDEPVLRWLRSLSPRKRRAIGVALYEILQHEGPNVEQGSAEVLARKGKRAKPERGSPEKILLRVFCHAHGNKIVLLLAGYDKGERSSRRHQQQEIELAKQRLRNWQARERAEWAPGARTRMTRH